MPPNLEKIRALLHDLREITGDHQEFWRSFATQRTALLEFVFDPRDGFGLELKLGDCKIGLVKTRNQLMILTKLENQQEELASVPRRFRTTAVEIYARAVALATAQ